jgi:hypothetical protein
MLAEVVGLGDHGTKSPKAPEEPEEFKDDRQWE